MSDRHEAELVGELLERLLGDAAFRVAFRRDPACACRARGLDGLAERFAPPSFERRTLEPRESRSGLGAVLVSGAMEGIGVAHGGGGHVALQTGVAPAVAVAADGPAGLYPGDAAPRARIAAWMADHAERRGLPRELPVMAALVESDLQNLPDGDRASVGYFQMQTVYWLDRYPGYPDKPELQLQWFIDEALAVRERRPELARDPDRWGEWIADIEQPAESLRWKYGARLGDARSLLDVPDPRRVAAAAAGVASAATGRQEAVPGVPAVAAQTGANAAVSSGDRAVDALEAEARRIDRAVVPYEWGGGHAAEQERGSPVRPLDCSGAVSRVLGIEPRVASEFEAWGAPGPGRRVTIYANDGHVLMEIDGHFWGTSAANPGGGAGWIPRRFISDAYLAQFTARHPPGQ